MLLITLTEEGQVLAPVSSMILLTASTVDGREVPQTTAATGQPMIVTAAAMTVPMQAVDVPPAVPSALAMALQVLLSFAQIRSLHLTGKVVGELAPQQRGPTPVYPLGHAG